MAIEIGTIKALIGSAIAKSANSADRILQIGDVVYQNDIIVTGEFGAVEIELTDGSLIDLGRNSEATLNPEALRLQDTPENDVTALQQAILDGVDPTQDAEPTAAGPETIAGNEGTNIVQVKHLAPETTPSSGFDTQGIDFAFPEGIEQFDSLIEGNDNTDSLVADNVTATANEAGLATGSDAASNSETVAGQLTVAGDSVTYGFTPGNTGVGNNGTLTLNSNGSFSYTLTSPVNSGANPGTNTVNGVETFNYTATDATGNTTTGTITINVIDDVPTAVVDTANVTEGETLTVDAASGVLNNDSFGADAPTIATVAGVAAGNNTATPVSTGIGTAIAGNHGILTLQADGSYTYQATADSITADMQDSFVYTIVDNDGDTSTTTLTIDVANTSLTPNNVSATANEAGLATGSDAASNSETVAGQLTVAGDSVTYGFTPGNTGVGNNGTLTLNNNGSFSYTLTSPVNSGANPGTNTVNGVETFNYTATDATGNTTTGTITINVIDDVPSIGGRNSTISLDDDALTGGNAGGTGDDVDMQNASGTLTHRYGADGEGTLLLLDTGAPTGFIYSLNGDGTVLTISQNGSNVVQMTLSDTSSGDYTVTQLAPISHAIGNDENNQTFIVSYQVTDNDGDTASSRVRINVDDDTPIVVIDHDFENIAYSFTVTNHDEVSSAGYNSSYGYYIKDAAGLPTTGVVIWDNVKHADATSITVSGEFTPDQVGFFIIPNGDGRNPSLTDNTEVTFQLVNGEWTAFDAGQPLIGNGSPVLFDNASLNKDNEDHVQDNALLGNQNWEDLPIVSGDGDYNDVNVNVDWTAVTTTGDSLNKASFGADGPGVIDFTLDDVTIEGTLTSNGKNVIFEARDTDNDGHNDLIVGSTEDGDVLSIEGILDANTEIHLFAPVNSSNTGTGNNDTDVEITANLSITDSDGDNALATLNFNLDIDQITTPTPPADII